MAEEDRGEKTEDATPYKLDELRKQGQVPSSKEVGTAALLLCVGLFFYFYGPKLYADLIVMIRTIFMKMSTFQMTEENLIEVFMYCVKVLGVAMAPLLIFAMIIGLASNILQTGVLFSVESMKPNLNKINPLKGIKKIFSARSAAELVKAIFKFVIIGGVLYLVMRNEIENSVLLMDKTPAQILAFVCTGMFKIVIYVSLLMVALAVVDFIYQRISFARENKMSKEEVKEELRNREGDPNIKARIKSLQRQMATNRMMDNVPNAQAVITNPTHLAIAIEYNKDMAAPKVIAKGADYIAEKIRKIAKENDIPLVENKPLAQTLYKTVKVGQYIPENLFNAVAEVLAYVMKIKSNLSETMVGSSEGQPDQIDTGA